MEKIEVKEDCFSFDEHRKKCKALKELYCEKEICNFYKKCEIKDQ